MKKSFLIFPYIAPYNLCAAYTPAVCNNGTLSYCGIGLENVGATIAPSGVGSEIYTDVVVGGPSSLPIPSFQNLFDNMTYGIGAQNSNVVSRNCAYMNLGVKGTGAGIYSYRDGTAAAAGRAYKLDVYGNALGYRNEFWGCATDVQANDLYYVRGIYSLMSSEHSSAALTGPQQGLYGYNVTVSQYYNVELNYNTIYNIKTGISSYLVPPPYTGEPVLTGQMTVDYNTIDAHAGGGGTTPYNEYAHTGIDVEALAYAAPIVGGSEINTDYNIIDHAYNGIMLIGFGADYQQKTTIGNMITVTPDVTAIPLGVSYEQAGIWHARNTQDFIEDNNVNGPGYSDPAPPSPVYTPSVTTTQTVLEGIHCGNLNGAYVCGNTTRNTNTGIFFGGYEGINAWANNTMENNAFGYILDGYIGSQPYSLVSYASFAYYTGNQWTNTGAGGFPGWTGTNWQTYTIGNPDLTLTGTGSPMEVRNTTLQNPTNNSADGLPVGPPPSYVYALAPTYYGIWVAAPGTDPWSCGIPSPTTVPAVYLRISRKQMSYVTDVPQKNWISQMMMYRQIASDTTVDTNAVLYSFKQMAANSRYKNLMDIENDIATGNYSAANTLLGNPIGYMASADSSVTTGAVLADSGGCAVVANYRAYYQLLVKYITDTLSTSDSAQIAALANMCPFVDGPIIYNARGLYNVVFNDSRVFSDVGCGGAGGGSERVAHSSDSSLTPTLSRGGEGGMQQYTLSPNPSDGSITLKQSVPDGNPVNAEIWNSTGVAIFNGQFHFVGGTTQFDMINKVPGLYLLQLTDSGGNVFLLKFVINGK